MDYIQYETDDLFVGEEDEEETEDGEEYDDDKDKDSEKADTEEEIYGERESKEHEIPQELEKYQDDNTATMVRSQYWALC